MLKHINIHALIRQNPNRLPTQVGKEVYPECICPPGTQLANFSNVQVELSAYLQGSWRECMGFRGTESLRIALND